MICMAAILVKVPLVSHICYLLMIAFFSLMPVKILKCRIFLRRVRGYQDKQ